MEKGEAVQSTKRIAEKRLIDKVWLQRDISVFASADDSSLFAGRLAQADQRVAPVPRIA